MHVHLSFIHFLGFAAMLMIVQFLELLISLRFSDSPIGQAFAVLTNA